MHARGASGDDNAGKVPFLDGLPDKILPRVGTHVLIVDTDSNARHMGDGLRYFLAVYRRADILSAMADENSDT